MAAAWDRLIEGNFVLADLKLLEHEFREALVLESGFFDYNSVHHMFDQIYDGTYNWGKYVG